MNKLKGIVVMIVMLLLVLCAPVISDMKYSDTVTSDPIELQPNDQSMDDQSTPAGAPAPASADEDANEANHEVDGTQTSITPPDSLAGEDLTEKITENIVAIGDSLTLGVGDNMNKGGYVSFVQAGLMNSGQYKEVQTVNLGKKGNQTSHLLKRLEKVDVQAQLKEANTVIISIGGNDMMKVGMDHLLDLTVQPFSEEVAEYELRLSEILEVIREINPESAIYILGLFNPFHIWFEDLVELDDIVRIWDETTAKVASQYDQVTFVPIHDIFFTQDNDLLSDDNFHPNEKGYELMAKRILNMMDLDHAQEFEQEHGN